MRWMPALLLLTILLSACSEQEPIKIGFIGSLTGRDAEVSQAARDGAILAIEEVNASGGINGRRLELTIYDDQYEHSRVIEGVNFFKDSGAVAIIGPIKSQMSVTAAPVAREREIVLLSPTTSASELSDQKDYFFRSIPACDINARNLATFAIQDLAVKRVAILQDLSNPAFTGPWRESFSEQFKKLGGSVVAEITFISSRENFSFKDLAEQTIVSGPDAILILSNSIDAALFNQQLAKLHADVKVLGSDWSFAGDLFHYGGKSVDGFMFTTNLNLRDMSANYLAFRGRFSERFGTPPKFPAVLGYEAADVLIKGLKKTQNMKALNITLENLGEVKGLQGPISLNVYGDALRPTFVNKVEDGDYVFVKRVP